MSDRPIAGFECGLFYKNGANWVEVKNAKDVSRPASREAIEASARFSKNKRYIPGMADLSVDFGYLYIKGTDPVFAVLQDAYVNGTPLEVAVADGPITQAGTTYMRDWFIVTKFDEGQELNSAVVYDVTLQPTVVMVSGALVERTYITVGS
jgi:hypothetical protein